MEERLQLDRIRELARETIQCCLQDQTRYDEAELRNVVELMARSVIDLTNLHLGEDADPPTSLKATVCKMRMIYNSMEKRKTDSKAFERAKAY